MRLWMGQTMKATGREPRQQDYDRIFFTEPKLITTFPYRAINGGSPYNVPAGHGSMNLEKVVAKYQQDFHNEEAAKLERLEARGEW